ncbi:MAG: hypothetical protein LAN61_12565 [Acidobacteriia bacterium]|nr:hypothetical protein [Terriglobia bacterium]
MDKFTQIGQRLDDELNRLRHFLEDQLAPEAERRTAEFFRELSQTLNAAASKLESHVASRRPRS